MAQAPPTSTLSIMFTAQLSVSAVLLNAHFYTFLKYFLQSFYTVISIWIYIITRCDPIEMYNGLFVTNTYATVISIVLLVQ